MESEHSFNTIQFNNIQGAGNPLLPGRIFSNSDEVMMTEGPLISCSTLSNAGNVREDNQDAIRVCRIDDPLNDTHGRLYAIADGMGGYSHGGVASSLALETFFSTVYSGAPNQIQQTLKRAINEANLAVYQKAQSLGVRRMGTTLTAVNLIGNQLHIAHVGDSRAYLVRNGKATLLTNDHTMVGELVRMKVLTPDKIRTHAQRSQLNKCLGIELFIQGDVTKITLQPGDLVILCTDGIWGVIEDDEFAQMAGRATGVDSLNQQLVEAALARDSDDNVSVVTLYAEKLAANHANSTAKGWGALPQILKSRFSDKL